MADRLFAGNGQPPRPCGYTPVYHVVNDLDGGGCCPSSLPL